MFFVFFQETFKQIDVELCGVDNTSLPPKHKLDLSHFLDDALFVSP